jgi:hypothetical protein
MTGEWWRRVINYSKTNLLVARANHRCCAFLAMPSSSDCSDAATDPQGYSAPTPIPRRKLIPVVESLVMRAAMTSGLTDMHLAWRGDHRHCGERQSMQPRVRKTGRQFRWRPSSKRNLPSQQRTIFGGRTYHPKLAANLVGDITKGKHADDSACEGYACQCLAVVVMFDGLRIKNFQNYIYAMSRLKRSWCLLKCSLLVLTLQNS